MKNTEFTKRYKMLVLVSALTKQGYNFTKISDSWNSTVLVFKRNSVSRTEKLCSDFIILPNVKSFSQIASDKSKIAIQFNF